MYLLHAQQDLKIAIWECSIDYERQTRSSDKDIVPVTPVQYILDGVLIRLFNIES